ncbi:MAG: hypothetical protein KDI01_09740 [Halioglobus sp.]|nr:hypothetical protein [Halioglobus sp.]
MVGSTPVKLKIPRQDLAAFNLFPLNAEAAQSWAQGLPVTNTRAVVQQLRQALGELNRIALAPELRYNIVEAVRPSLEVAVSNLSRRFLKQPLVMPEEPRQMAALAEELLNMLGTAYIIVAIEAITHRDSIRDTNPARLACEAIHRAVVFTGRKILLTLQLHRPIEPHGWLSLHQLYALADGQQLTQLPLTEPLSGARSIAAAYLQALMLGCCKPNQLRQSDLAAIYRGLKKWSEFIQIHEADKSRGLFIVDLTSDRPPLYSSLHTAVPHAQCRSIDTEPLIRHLRQLREGDAQRGIHFDKDTTLSFNTLEHIIISLGEMSLRNFKRSSMSGPLSVCIGLSSAHYHVGGEKSFEQQLYGDDYTPPASDQLAGNPFLRAREQQTDPWRERDASRREAAGGSGATDDAQKQDELDAQAQALLMMHEDTQLPPQGRYCVFQVELANASPGGYCLQWNPELPGDIRTGDIVGIREQQGRDWVIAVIRWLSNLEQGRTLIGLELLSPRAMPYGARIHKKTGEKGAPLRVLLLPEIKLVGQPHTLITPRAGFRENQKISLLRHGEEFHIQLLRQVAATGSYTQFDFRYVKQLGDVLAEDRGGVRDSYDSLWSNI